MLEDRGKVHGPELPRESSWGHHQRPQPVPVAAASCSRVQGTYRPKGFLHFKTVLSTTISWYIKKDSKLTMINPGRGETRPIGSDCCCGFHQDWYRQHRYHQQAMLFAATIAVPQSLVCLVFASYFLSESV